MQLYKGALFGWEQQQDINIENVENKKQEEQKTRPDIKLID